MEIRAQGKTIQVVVERLEETVDTILHRPIRRTIAVDGARIYGFLSKKKGEQWISRLQKDKSLTEADINKGTNIVDVTANGGRGTLRGMNLDGYIIVFCEDGSFAGEEVKDRLNIKISMRPGRQMQTVTVKGHDLTPNPPVVPRQRGNRIPIIMDYILEEDETGDNLRIGLAPIATVMGTQDTAMIIRPFVKDGGEYHTTMKRRMGYDMQHDALFAYTDTLSYMVAHRPDTIKVRAELYPVSMENNYPVTATKWIEDYNGLLKSTEVIISEGYTAKPARFLEFTIPEIEIDTARYRKMGFAVRSSAKRAMHLNFIVGKAELDMADSTNVVQVNQLVNDISKYANSDIGGVDAAYVKAWASPDGRYAKNVDLSRQRASYFKNLIKNRFAYLSFDESSSEVASWLQVADSLEQEDSMIVAATRIREIVSAYPKDKDSQFLKIKQESFYTSPAMNRILENLRVVEFTFSYWTEKVREPSEILELYNSRDDYRNGKACQDYELYQLFRIFSNDFKKLEPLAQSAYESGVIRDDYEDRPWPLAAYFLAKCYHARELTDTTILKPYLDWKNRRFHRRPGPNLEPLGYYNDPAIVALQIAMMCQANDYYMADSVALLLPNEKKYARLRDMLNFLNGDWDKPEVRDNVASTSTWNKVIAYSAQDNDDFYQKYALQLLLDSFPETDARARYQEAILRFTLMRFTSNPKLGYPIDNFQYYSDEDYQLDNWGLPSEEWLPKKDWGYPMARACFLDEKYLKYVKYDGYFNKAYRESFEKFWPQLKQEMLEAIQAEAAKLIENHNNPKLSDENVQ